MTAVPARSEAHMSTGSRWRCPDCDDWCYDHEPCGCCRTWPCCQHCRDEEQHTGPHSTPCRDCQGWEA